MQLRIVTGVRRVGGLRAGAPGGAAGGSSRGLELRAAGGPSRGILGSATGSLGRGMWWAEATPGLGGE